MKLLCPICETRIPDHLLRTRPSDPCGGVFVSCPHCHGTSRCENYSRKQFAAISAGSIALLAPDVLDIPRVIRLLLAITALVIFGAVFHASRGARKLTPIQDAHADEGGRRPSAFE